MQAIMSHYKVSHNQVVTLAAAENNAIPTRVRFV